MFTALEAALAGESDEKQLAYATECACVCNEPYCLPPMFSRYFLRDFSDSFQCWVMSAVKLRRGWDGYRVV